MFTYYAFAVIWPLAILNFVLIGVYGKHRARLELTVQLSVTTFVSGTAVSVAENRSLGVANIFRMPPAFHRSQQYRPGCIILSTEFTGAWQDGLAFGQMAS